MIAALLLALLAAEPAPQAAPPKRFLGASAEQLQEMVAEVAALPDVRSRVLAASERFLDVPYHFDPLGEGPGHPPDEDPRLRWDLADCQTYLETVLALARTRPAAPLLETLDDIRYEGSPDYAHRNHFFEAQWVPVNVRKGYVKDVTASIGGKDAVQHVKEISRKQWDARTIGEKIALPEDRVPLGKFPVSYVPLKMVVAHAKDIPSGTLFAIVRADRPLMPTMISHLGLVVQKPEGTFLRHAGRELYMRVVDEPIAHLVERNLTYKKWPVLGLWFLEVQEPAPAPTAP